MVAIYACHCLGNYVNLRQYHAFCLGTGVPRHSAVGIGTFVRLYIRTYIHMYVVRIFCNEHAQVMESRELEMDDTIPQLLIPPIPILPHAVLILGSLQFQYDT